MIQHLGTPRTVHGAPSSLPITLTVRATWEWYLYSSLVSAPMPETVVPSKKISVNWWKNEYVFEKQPFHFPIDEDKTKSNTKDGHKHTEGIPDASSGPPRVPSCYCSSVFQWCLIGSVCLSLLQNFLWSLQGYCAVLHGRLLVSRNHILFKPCGTQLWWELVYKYSISLIPWVG